VPPWYLLVGTARYLFLAGEWLRRRLGKPVYELPPDFSRRLMAGLQMGFLAALLWPAFTPPGTKIAATLFGIPFLYGFGRDWLVASGMVKPDQETTNTQAWLARWFPSILRLALLALALGPMLERYRIFGALEPGLAALTVLESLALLMLALGIAGRAAAILGLVLLGFHQMNASLIPVQIAQIGVYTAILYMGSGALSLWRPEEYLIHRRVGERTRTRLNQHVEQSV
jgi:CDP-diacylglycerol--glycerol-3-phosphate 3-phosphatidyltransferase